MECKKIFLTGGTGLVGTNLTKNLSIKEYSVKSISRQNQPPLKGIEWLIYDMNNSDLELCKQLEGVDVIIHNGASLNSGKTKEGLDEIKNVNILFTEKLLSCASKVGIRKFIFTSSYSHLQKPLPDLITEESDMNPMTAYAKSKYIGENLIGEYSSKHGFNYSILRLSSPVSFNFNLMPNTVLKNWIIQSQKMETIDVYGSGGRSQDFVSVSDIADVFLSSIKKNNPNGIYNVASGNTISMLEIAKLVTNKFGNEFRMCGSDDYEMDRWNISISKSAYEFGYMPKYSSKEVILKLLDQFN